MVAGNRGNGGNGDDARMAARWLRWEALVLIGVFPVVAMALECCSCWRLNAEWVAMYMGVTTLALVATKLAKR